MRQKQVANANILATQSRQREGIRKEQEKIRAAKAAKKQANAERLNTQPPSLGTTTTGTLPDPTLIKEVDPEILLETRETTKK
jgi:hypothetical protein